ncbi:MAG: ABC transporter ATP-binding protein, partial [Limisphaerales bacterium]
MNDPFLCVRGVTKYYKIFNRSLEVLRGVNLQIERGEFLALRGASGAGKSTLLHLMGGLDSPNSGEILLGGRDIAKFSETELSHFRNRRVGFIFQAYHLLPELTALENVCLPARIGRLSAPAAAARAAALLQQVGLKDR